MGQYEQHVFVCTTGSTCPTEADTESYVKQMRAEIARRVSTGRSGSTSPAASRSAGTAR